MNYLKTNIKYLRLERELTLEEMAMMLGLKGKSGYYAYENGLADPPIDKLLLLSKMFEVSIDTLIKKDLSNGEIGWEQELSKRIDKIEKRITAKNNVV